MYNGFKLLARFQGNEDSYYQRGLELYSENKKTIINSLDNYISTDSVLDGEKMEEDWFPQVNTDIFISHSHKDQELAITLSGWLLEVFGITSFIDSLIWGCADDLIKEIDGRYCYNDQTNTYNYTLRNLSTSHVHMMLSTALQKMIHKTECLFFINTPNSTMVSEIENQTLSPWIYSEIVFSKIVKRVRPLRYRHLRLTNFATGKTGIGSLYEKDMKISHSLDIDHLIDIDSETLNKWAREFYLNKDKSLHALDVLYNIVNAQMQISYIS
ncbi:MAG: hypothetical protein PHT07_01195 [Paludibacter sp.]|nr:hypothetical protein [Paludibacter sp.]